MILEEDSNKRFGVPSVFEFFYDVPYFLAFENHKKIKYVESGLQILTGWRLDFFLSCVQKIRGGEETH